MNKEIEDAKNQLDEVIIKVKRKYRLLDFFIVTLIVVLGINIYQQKQLLDTHKRHTKLLDDLSTINENENAYMVDLDTTLMNFHKIVKLWTPSK